MFMTYIIIRNILEMTTKINFFGHKPSRWDFKKASIKAKKFKGGMVLRLCLTFAVATRFAVLAI